MTSTPSASPQDRPRPGAPDTRPIPLVGVGTGGGAAPGAATAGRRGRLVAALRTRQGAGAAATVTGAVAVLAVALATSPPTGPVDLGAAVTGMPGRDVVVAPPAGGAGTVRDAAVRADTLPGGAEGGTEGAPVGDPGAVAEAVADGPAGPDGPAAADDTDGPGADDVLLRLVPADVPEGGGRAPAEVSDVRAAVTSAPGGCPASALQVWTPTAPLTLHLAAGVPVSVGARAGAPSACRRAPVVVTGTVTVTGRDDRSSRVTVSGAATLPAATGG